MQLPNGHVTHDSILLHVTQFDLNSWSTLIRILHFSSMLGSWNFDSIDLVLHLKQYFRTSTQTAILLPSARYSIVTAITVSWLTLLVIVRCYSVSSSYLISDLQSLIHRIYCNKFIRISQSVEKCHTFNFNSWVHQLDDRQTQLAVST